ncbi:ATP-dependent zinc metalloprotease FtsH [Porphyromonas gingivalis]|uniref:ATP-dependent zinc metalloprotease FtsH n=1 Tax=Porphyromonas gingivalis TaxID=837 RepID=UPI000975020C|nr:ATP-dependent zinc metalloprotease FtsH [Porphyromonas gingivalis]ATR93388.1 ATP-dependent zinc metalloprotease FtsH [Porphyromonas gingivalis]ATS08389.1 ATP-dependent zinc metalloprotease FtsH [Porphyromonas gingivalis]SJL21036.1 cell division protein FtsH [Porphyromonas gingivalis]
MANNGNNKKPGKPMRFNPIWLYAPVFLILATLFFVDRDITSQKELSWNEFQNIAKKQAFTDIVVNRKENTLKARVDPAKVDSVFKKGDIPSFQDRGNISDYYINTQIPSVDKFSDFYDQNQITAKVKYEDSKFSFTSILIAWGPLILLLVFWFWMMRRMSGGGGGSGSGGGVFNVGKSKAKLYDKTNIHVTFSDVAGLHEAKQEVEEIVHFLKNPSKYTELGGKIPKGALLVGPPGTGKTLLAKAVAGEAHVPFFSLSGSDFVEMFVGVGASRVRDLFRQAKEKAPCIIFIDEIDAVGRARGKGNNFSGNDERENTLNQLLTEMDGFGSNSGVIILAATNRADVLDSALLRAGRFDRQIYVDLPDLNDRKEIFLVHLKPLKTDKSVDVEFLSRQTPGFSGADIANVCNEAALIAARSNKNFVDKEDFMNAVDRIVGGLEKKNKITTEEERRSIAIHEAGHATISWMLRYANPLVKVTIVPRGKALGAAWYLPEERQITTTEALQDQLCALLGGRAAEDLFLGRVSTGAANDLERVTKLAYAMVTYYGMSDKLPNINYYEMQNDGWNLTKPYSDTTAEVIDAEVNRIISEQYERAKSILRKHEAGHHELADLLLKREVILADDVERIFGKRPWASRTEELLGLNAPATATEETTADAEAPIPVEGEEKTEEHPE